MLELLRSNVIPCMIDQSESKERTGVDDVLNNLDPQLYWKPGHNHFVVEDEQNDLVGVEDGGRTEEGPLRWRWRWLQTHKQWVFIKG